VAGVPVVAQSGRATLTGTVTDTNGAVIPGAAITLKETQTGSSYDSKSGPEGLFHVYRASSGNYALEVNAAGFEAYRQVGIDVLVGSTSTVNAQLKVGSADASVTVNSDASHLETESSDVASPCRPRCWKRFRCPSAARSATRWNSRALARIRRHHEQPTPPRHPPETSNSVADKRAAKTSCSTAPPPSSLRPTCRSPINFSVEAVSEFKVMTNTFDAQFGSASGGVVNLVSKQGTNTLHGSAYDLSRPRPGCQQLTSDYANAQAGKIVDTKPIDTQNDFGASVGDQCAFPGFTTAETRPLLLQLRGLPQENGGPRSYRHPPRPCSRRFLVPVSTTTINGQTFPAHILYDYSTCHRRQPGTALPGLSEQQITEAADPVFAAASKVMPSQPPPALTSTSKTAVPTTSRPTSGPYAGPEIGTRTNHRQLLHRQHALRQHQSLGSLYTGGNIQGNKYVRMGYDFIISPMMLTTSTPLHSAASP